MSAGRRLSTHAALIAGFGALLAISLPIGFEPGILIGQTFVTTLIDMM